MPKKSPPSDVKKPSSKKVDTTVIVALIALAGTLGTALFSSPVILEWMKSNPAPTVSSSSAQSQPPSNSSSSSPAPSLTGGNGDCLKKYFADIDPARQISLEAGADEEYYLLSQDAANKDYHGPLGIKLTQNGDMVAALSFLFFNDSHIFKIVSIVDSHCQAVSTYSNWTNGGDHNTLHDSDTLKIDLSGSSLSLRFIFYKPNDLRLILQ